ncbi:ADP-heptose--LPS heptosyltransferase I [Photobacterium rosenbergii]|uniref:ADP-heptose--LPS heptosyltransferase I n=1 Tax=Photobacterium rosenbergii TaxID=294936 RepID=A0A2T3NCP7_9GAMM|nr:glycosyltransferase family 9 protein [Photobacterium rosenbergii]PSW11824.1 ADP-heptose--LPS heptosyltransferase I [Photobacterium rosenbergii]
MALFTAPPRSICILRLSAIGDVCHAISVVQAIQAHWPSTEITWVSGKIEAQLIGDLPGIKVVVFDKKAGWAGMKAVWKALKGQKFDALLHMQAALRASALSLGIKARYRIGFSKNRTKEGQWLFTNRHLPSTESFHVLDNFADFARYLGVPFEAPHWNIPLGDDNKAFAQQQINGKPTLIISPAASKDERNWLTERYSQLADYAAEKGMQVLLCGSPAPREIALGEAISQHCQHAPVNLIGKTSLKQLTALLGAADVVVAPDTGPAHLATTQGTPVIGLYAHSNPKRTGPYNSLAYVASVYEQHAKQQHGKPVAELPWGTRVKGDTLMQDIQLDDVTAILDQLIS